MLRLCYAGQLCPRPGVEQAGPFGVPGEIRSDRVDLRPHRIGGVDDLIGEAAGLEELEVGLRRIELRAAGQPTQQQDAVRDFKRPGATSACNVKKRQLMPAVYDQGADVQQVPVHRAGVRIAAGKADRRAGLR